MARKAGDKDRWIAAVRAGDAALARKIFRETPGDCIGFMLRASQFRVPEEGLELVRKGAAMEKDAGKILEALREVCSSAVQFVEEERALHTGGTPQR